MIERYCTLKDCPGTNSCHHKGLAIRSLNCPYEYLAANYDPKHRWKGDGNPPRRWVALDGTVVYRSFSDYCD